MTKRHIRIYFSDIFGVSSKKVTDYGAFNISLINDLPLFVDPFLLFNSTNPKYNELHAEIIKYMIFLKEKSKLNLLPGLVKTWYHFPEVKENWLGFSKVGNDGRGLGPKFARVLKSNLTSIFSNFGEETETGTQLGKLTLIKSGVGRDNISDFTCNLIRGFLAEYTEKFAADNIDTSLLHTFAVPKSSFNYQTQTWSSKQYKLPRYGNQFVLLTPIDILTKDEAWISHKGFVEDFSGILNSVPNEQLRDQMSMYMAKVLPTTPTKPEYEEAVEKVARKYPALMDYYIKQQEADSEGATTTSAEKVQAAQELFEIHLRRLITLLDKTAFYETGHSSYLEGLNRVNFLKHVIENQDGYKLFYVKGKPISRESDLQIMFKLTWFASKFSADAEVNNGRGPADFMISYGNADKSIIEFKLAKSSSLEKNILKQAEIYATASGSKNPPIKVILYFNLRELQKVQLLLGKHNLLNNNSIVLIDAQPKSSASKT